MKEIRLIQLECKNSISVSVALMPFAILQVISLILDRATSWSCNAAVSPASSSFSSLLSWLLFVMHIQTPCFLAELVDFQKASVKDIHVLKWLLLWQFVFPYCQLNSQLSARCRFQPLMRVWDCRCQWDGLKIEGLQVYMLVEPNGQVVSNTGFIYCGFLG